MILMRIFFFLNLSLLERREVQHSNNTSKIKINTFYCQLCLHFSVPEKLSLMAYKCVKEITLHTSRWWLYLLDKKERKIHWTNCVMCYSWSWTANQRDLSYRLNMFRRLNVGHSTDAHMELSEGWLVSLVCWLHEGNWLALSAFSCSNSHVMWKKLRTNPYWYVSHSLYLHSKANLFFCWKLFHCTEIFLSGRLQTFEMTKVKTCSITLAVHHPALKKWAKTARFTGSCTASKQVRPQNPNMTDLDPVQQNVTHCFLIESQGICWQFTQILMCQS